jgi:hypothetical protein
MKLGKAKDYYANGLIKSFRAVLSPMQQGIWLLEIDGTKGSIWVLKKADGVFREYKSASTVVQEVERITGGEVKEFKVL